MADGGETADAVRGGDSEPPRSAPLSDGKPDNAPAPDGAGARAWLYRVVAANAGARSVSSANAALVDRFISATESATALMLWFGENASSLAGDRSHLRAALLRDLAELDEAMTRLANAILHHPRFQRLEALWRGVELVVDAADEADVVNVRVLDVRWGEIARDLERAVEFDQSSLFQKIYSEEFGMPGGTPYGVLVVDHELQHKPRPGRAADDLSTVTGLAQIAQASFAPVILGASPPLFGLETFREFGLPIDLRAVFRGNEYGRYKRFRQSEEARFVGLTVPRVLLRLPWSRQRSVATGFPYSEDRFGRPVSGHLWGNAGFAFATILIRAFIQYRWFADIRGVQRDQTGGGLVTDLPTTWFDTEAPRSALKYSVDVALTDRVEKDLDDLGFISLRNCKDTPYSVFYGSQSVHTESPTGNEVARANERLSTMLRYTLCVSRFAHYLKVMVRDRIGSFTTAEEIENDLHRWLMNYTIGNDDADLETKARYPLREAQCQVRDMPGRPGSYRCIIHLKPHFQLDDVVSSFRLVTEMTSLAGRQ